LLHVDRFYDALLSQCASLELLGHPLTVVTTVENKNTGYARGQVGAAYDARDVCRGLVSLLDSAHLTLWCRAKHRPGSLSSVTFCYDGVAAAWEYIALVVLDAPICCIALLHFGCNSVRYRGLQPQTVGV